MNTKLSTKLTFGFSLIVFVTVVLIYITANIGVGRQYEEHLKLQQKKTADTIATGLSQQYNFSTGKWNIDYIHGYGMYALNEGYIVKVYDNSGNVVWDAENHDMTLCHKIMDNIITKMKEKRPEIKGSFYKYDYDLVNNDTKVGVAKISYYSPYSMNEIDFKFLDALNKLLLVLGVGAVVVAGISGYFLAKYISNPIEKVTDTTRKISEGNYNIEMKNNIKTKELLELKNAVNQMAYNLKNQEMLRKRLVTDVAHELRTPLTAIKGWSETIATSPGDKEVTKKGMKVISEESERLSNMVEELLDFSRIQGGRFNLNKANMDVFAELTDAVIIYSEKARQENKTLLYDEPQEIVTIFGDRNRIRQVFINIIDNAIKYSAADGHIIVATAVTDKAVIITVEDDGCGIASSDLTKVKAKFYKANSSVRGSGIGLAVADEIVAAHDGTLDIESELGRYTRVVITLPVAKKDEQ